MLLDHFESLGDNCEFGFFQRSMGYEDGSFFRWTMIHDLTSLVDLIRTDFPNVFRLENLVPCAAGAVMDYGSGMLFHTTMSHRQVESGDWVFDGTDAERKALHDVELQKINYLIDKFRRSARSGTKIYVIKKNAQSPAAHLTALLNALNVHGDARLLMVNPATRHAIAGSVHRIGDKIYAGYVSRLADYETADKICITSWRSVVERTYEMACVHDKDFASAIAEPVAAA